jgi:hypothetical protein
MLEHDNTLLSASLAKLAGELAADAQAARPWAEARRALDTYGERDAELRAAVDAKDAAALGALVVQWQTGKRHLPEHDREVLKRALKAFRKSLKLTRLDAESSLGVGPMSSGRQSGIVGMTPPPRYPREVWDELVRQGRLLAGRHGTYELPPE